MTLAAGTKLGRYEIVGAIGAGGMGEVYRARDTQLGRDVAIKVLPASYARDAQRLRRFQQEARAAGQLNHPNILTVHDFGMHDGAPYVVSELLEGESLRERLSGHAAPSREHPSHPAPDASARTPASGATGESAAKSAPTGVSLPPRKAIEYGTQIANGLAAAHEKGIVHRDLKPENIFITRDGRAKILDFGLAKLIAPETEGETRTQLAPGAAVTDSGVVLGTAGYMSPEQVRAQPTDHRSDIFSFGAILYEMLSGRRAFHRDSSVETMSAILKEEPEEITATNHQVSPALQRVVDHCLEKDPEARFQSARDLAFALEAVSGISGSSAAEKALAPSAPASRRKRRLIFAAIGTVGLVVVAIGAYFLGRGASQTSTPEYHRLTFRRGIVDSARFSPDGQTILYASKWEGDPMEVFSTRPDSPESRSLGLPPGTDILGVSPSGEMALLLNAQFANAFEHSGTLAEMALAGGAPREMLTDVTEADWSPDGKQLLVVREEPRGRQESLEYPMGKVLYRTHGWIGDPRISPDGKQIAFIDHFSTVDDGGSVAVVDLSGKKQTVTNSWDSARGLAWSPSGKDIWFTASPNAESRALYSVTLSGRVRQLVAVPGALYLFDTTRDGRVLLKEDDERYEMVALSPNWTGERDLSWLDWSLVADLSSDGKSVLFTEGGEGGGGNYGVYLRKLDGSPAILLGQGEAMAISPDGQWAIATHPHDPGPTQLFLLPTGVGEPRQLTSDQLDHGNACWLPDGKGILFSGSENGRDIRVYSQSLAGGAPRAITPNGFGVFRNCVSPDGKSFIASSHADNKWVLIPVSGGNPRPIGDIGPAEVPIRWSADGRSIFLEDFSAGENVPAKIVRLDIATGKRTTFKELVPADQAGFAGVAIAGITPDGKTMIYSYWHVSSNLYQLRFER